MFIVYTSGNGTRRETIIEDLRLEGELEKNRNSILRRISAISANSSIICLSLLEKHSKDVIKKGKGKIPKTFSPK